LARFVGVSPMSHLRTPAALTAGREAGASPPHVERAPTAVPADAHVVAVRWTTRCSFSRVPTGLHLGTMRAGVVVGKPEAKSRGQDPDSRRTPHLTIASRRREIASARASLRLFPAPDAWRSASSFHEGHLPISAYCSPAPRGLCSVCTRIQSVRQASYGTSSPHYHIPHY
jgi:hypothetical protein